MQRPQFSMRAGFAVVTAICLLLTGVVVHPWWITAPLWIACAFLLAGQVETASLMTVLWVVLAVMAVSVAA